jgi:glycosyltransferase involved in cell wall biosynthesis
MNYYIVIPAHNEAALIGLTLESLVTQTLPKKIVIVNDNSTDNTADIVLAFAKEHPFIIVEKKSSAIHLPGSK